MDKGKLGLGKLFIYIEYVAQFVGNQPLLGLLLVEPSSSHGYLDVTNLLLFGSFFFFFSKIKNLGIYICSLQQVLIHCSSNE